MAKGKEKTVWFCTECGADSPKWEGRCPSCGAWNTMVEEKVPATAKKGISGGCALRPMPRSPTPAWAHSAVRACSAAPHRIFPF